MAAKKSAQNSVPTVNKRPAWLVYTTLTNSTEFCEWIEKSSDMNVLPVKGRSVFIKGGAGLAQKTLVTPLGIATELNQSEMDFLNSNAMFLKHVKDGWMVAIKATGWQADPDAVAADLSQRDGSCQFVPNDYVEDKELGDLSKVVAPTMGNGHKGYNTTLHPRFDRRVISQFR